MAEALLLESALFKRACLMSLKAVFFERREYYTRTCLVLRPTDFKNLDKKSNVFIELCVPYIQMYHNLIYLDEILKF